MKYITNYSGCFVCGDKNDAGLQNRFWVEDGRVVTEFRPLERHIGHGAVHGGISAALLDEAMGLSATIAKNRLCVTLEINVQYLKPMNVDSIYKIRARMAVDKNILCETEGEITDVTGAVLIKATGRYVPLSMKKSHEIHASVFNIDGMRKDGK